MTRTLFPEADDAVLSYHVEEGQSIEPYHYVPIVCLSLINGAEGIGTGWSTFIPQHDPREVVTNVRHLMNGRESQPMHPWYKGYTGTITENPEERKHIVTGVYNVLGDDELEITELPIGKWTRDYKNFLEELVIKEWVEDIREYHQENRVHFVLTVPKLAEIVAKDGIVKFFKLQSSLSAANQVLFNEAGQIHRYRTEQDILKEWFDLRSELYTLRKEYMLAKLKKDHEVLRNKSRFIKAVIDETVHIKRVKRQEIVKQLKAQGFATQSELDEIQKDAQRGTVVQNEADEVVGDE